MRGLPDGKRDARWDRITVRHLLEHKSAKRRRFKRRDTGLAPADNREALRLLGKK